MTRAQTVRAMCNATSKKIEEALDNIEEGVGHADEARLLPQLLEEELLPHCGSKENEIK